MMACRETRQTIADLIRYTVVCACGPPGDRQGAVGKAVP